MTASELQQLIVNDLIRRHGGSRQRWRVVVGPLKLYARATHPHCNWDVRPTGSAAEVAAVEAVADALRDRFDDVRAG